MDSISRRTILFELLHILLSVKCTATEDEIRAKLGSAVHFVLPEVAICGRYNFMSPLEENVIDVHNTSHISISNLFERRGTHQLLANGTLLFTLHHIQNSDEGPYRVKPDGKSPEQCWKKFELTLIKDSSSTGYWLTWQPWSSCDNTCGSATSFRTRECSIPSYCHNGDSHEVRVCTEKPPCYEWSNWSKWNTCSVTCGDGWYSRHRFCLTFELSRAAEEHCSGNTYEKQTCSMKPCQVDQPPVYQWTKWGSWNTCSQPCGTGFQTRDRQCHDSHAIVHSYSCVGLETENRTCSLSSCHDEGDSTGSDGMPNTNDQTVQLPLSGIVGAGAGLFILILTIVICILVIKLKRKRRILGVVKTGSVKKTNTVSNKTYRGKRASAISCSSQGVSGVHVYDDINSDDVRSQRMSVLTIDNPYVMLPASPRGPTDAVTGTVTYSNTQETVFVFDNATPGDVAQGQKRKVSNAYQNTSNNLAVPRHMSVDSTGYLMPGNAMERAARRNMKYTKKT